MAHLRYIQNKQGAIAQIRLLANNLFDNEEARNHMGEFIPPIARVPSSEAFTQFLIRQAIHCWIIFEVENDNNPIGFIMISNLPQRNNFVGVGLLPQFVSQRIMSNCWNEAVGQFQQLGIISPLNAETSKRNIAANNFMIKNGFTANGDTDFMGEASNAYLFNF